MKPRIARCPACGRKARRSSEANRRYWALLHEISECVKPGGRQYSSEAFHEYFKTRYLGADDVELPNGATLTRPRSSSDLETSEFNDYMTQVEAWAAERGVFLEA